MIVHLFRRIFFFGCHIRIKEYGIPISIGSLTKTRLEFCTFFEKFFYTNFQLVGVKIFLPKISPKSVEYVCEISFLVLYKNLDKNLPQIKRYELIRQPNKISKKLEKCVKNTSFVRFYGNFNVFTRFRSLSGRFIVISAINYSFYNEPFIIFSNFLTKYTFLNEFFNFLVFLDFF